MKFVYSGPNQLNRVWVDDAPQPTADRAAWAWLMEEQRKARVDRVETLSAAHRLIQSLSEQTQSRSELDECRDVMSQLERMVEDA